MKYELPFYILGSTRFMYRVLLADGREVYIGHKELGLMLVQPNIKWDVAENARGFKHIVIPGL